MVGDTPADLAMGRSAGAGRVIGVLSGVGRREELAPLADVLLPSIGELLLDGQIDHPTDSERRPSDPRWRTSSRALALDPARNHRFIDVRRNKRRRSRP